jgi:ankyrin repeat protein
MAQRQEQQANKPQRHWERTREVLISAAQPIKRLFIGRRLDNLLIKAASDGENSKILRLIKTGASIAAKDSYGWTALHNAASYGHTETCILIIEKYTKSGRNINKFIAAKEKNGNTALHWAAMKGHIETCELLIREYAKAGGDAKDLIIAKDNEGYTALHLAAFYGHTQACLLLIEEYAKAGGNAKELIAINDNCKRTALQYAENKGRIQTAQFLKSIELLGDIIEVENIKPFLSDFRGCIGAISFLDK